jgi:hypothetical protein
MQSTTTTVWKNATTEDIDRAVNGSISSGALTRTVAKKTILDRLIYALDRSCYINKANLHSSLLIYNLHREMDGKPPVKNLDGRNINIFSIFVARDEAGDATNELYIIESGEIVRVGGFGVKNDLFSRRLSEFILDMGKE